MKRVKKGTKIVLIGLAVFIACLFLQTLPVFFVKPIGAKELVDRNVIVYYQPGDEPGAREVFGLLKEKAASVRARMNFTSATPTKAYLYKSQFSLFIREAGFVTLLFAPSWYIGDNEGENILMVSPNTKVEGHTHDSILNATLHELVHTINYQVNPELSYFWDNGLATYLAEQAPDQGALASHPVPTFADLKTENGLKFGNMGGYAFPYTYLEYLDKTYGWQKVIDYASGRGTHEEVFGRSEREIYEDWREYLKNR